jgi:hypothetical protein
LTALFVIFDIFASLDLAAQTPSSGSRSDDDVISDDGGD